MMFTMQEPFYGILLSSMRRVPIPEVGTLGVRRSGNVFMLGYNPDFVNKFSVDTVIQLLKHEVLHVALNHFTIWEGQDKNDDEYMHRIRNIAADLEVNSYLDRTKMDQSAGGVWAEDMGWEKCAGTREYFSRLMANLNNRQQQAQAQHPQKPCNGGQGGQGGQSQNQQSNSNQNQPSSNGKGNPSQNSQQSRSGNGQQQNGNSGNTPGTTNGNGSGKTPSQQAAEDYLNGFNTFDDHSKWPDDDDPSTREELQQTIDTMLAFAAEEVEKNCGSVPGELKGRIDQIRKKPKPVTDWKRHFRRYLGNEFTEFIRKSKKRESRRFPDAAGNRHRRKSHILVAIDTSGSVSMPEYREFMGQIRTLTATADFHVVECDAVIQYEYDYKNRPNEYLHGGGGTSFQPVVNLFNKDKKKYDALVYFTDGYCDIPNDTPKDTLWVISSNGDQSDRKRYKVNGASVAFIPKRNQ